MSDPYTFDALIADNARLRKQARELRQSVKAWKRAAGAADRTVTTLLQRAGAASVYSRIATLTRLVGKLQDEVAARDVVLRVGDEARSMGANHA